MRACPVGPSALLRWLKPGRSGIYSARPLSDHDGQFGERVGETSRRSDIGPEVVEAPAKVLDEGVPADDHPRSSITLQPSHRSEARLETPVVSLERNVRVDLRVVEDVFV